MVQNQLAASQPWARLLPQAGRDPHTQDLANKISRLQKEIEDRAGNLLDVRDRMIHQRLWLQNELDNVGAG